MNNIQNMLIVAALLNLISNNCIFATEVIQDDGHGDLHQDHPVIYSTSAKASVEDDGHGDLHRDPPAGKNTSFTASHL